MTEDSFQANNSNKLINCFSEIWNKLLKVPDLCLCGISEPAVIGNDADKMVVCSTKDGRYPFFLYFRRTDKAGIW